MSAEKTVREFYEGGGWESDESGATLDARLWEDLRPGAAEYVTACRRKVLSHLPRTGHLLLDAGSGPIQYPEYVEYSDGFSRRVCMDVSLEALKQARARLGSRGLYVCASLPEVPFGDNEFDAVISLHTIYHVEAEEQEVAVRQLIRVAKPNARIVIVYANPDRLLLRIKRRIRPKRKAANDRKMYYHAHPLSWWQRFAGESSLKMLPWRALVAQESALISGRRVAKLLLRLVLGFEKRFPGLMTHVGAYPLIVLTK